MASKLLGELVVDSALGSESRLYRVVAIDEPRGRPPTAEEQAATASVSTRTPPKDWRLTKLYEPMGKTGRRPTDWQSDEG